MELQSKTEPMMLDPYVVRVQRVSVSAKGQVRRRSITYEITKTTCGRLQSVKRGGVEILPQLTENKSPLLHQL